jgi:hypothetical protein
MYFDHTSFCSGERIFGALKIIASSLTFPYSAHAGPIFTWWNFLY